MVNIKREFIQSSEPEPHSVRRVQILEKYPEIKQLFGYEWRTKYMVAATVLLQVYMAWLTLEWRWPAYLAAIYVVGATANHSLFLAVHELSHNLGAQRPEHNKMIGFLANLAIGIPYSATFKPYHMDHHRYQGQSNRDTDVPSFLEGYVITESAFGYADHAFRKAVFAFFQIVAYALRPMFIKPDLVPLDRWIVYNYITVLSFDAVLIWFLGPFGFVYLFLSTFLAGSIHPCAGHFIAEHYVMEGTTETYSYYGPLNRLAYNVGYHNEHHDFPSIPWSRLPKVRKVAPEFYDDLPQCRSWPGTIFRFIFDDSISPFSRVRRTPGKVD